MTELKLDLSKDTGMDLKPFHGMNNGPLINGGTGSIADVYEEIGVPSVRLHDTYGAYSRFAVDISKIFPNFDADENDPENYYFQHTDELLQAIKDCGADIVYRLGESIDHTIYARSARPPKDFEKWANICMHVIRHYNEGWADGFHLNIKYWEIWNEPEGVNGQGRQTQWRGGTLTQAFDLYKVIALKIKEYDPTLKVGGMSFINCNQPMEKFVAYCSENKLPLDFVSSHGYGRSTTRMKDRYFWFKDFMAEKGYPNVEWLLAEWNFYDDVSWDRKEGETLDMPPKTKEQHKRVCEYLQGMPGASFASYLFTFLQDSPFTMMHYYQVEPLSSTFNGVLDVYKLKRKGFYAFKAYGDMYRANRRIKDILITPEPNYRAFTAMATEDYILITNYSKEEKEVCLDAKGISNNKKEYCVYCTDEDRDAAEVEKGSLENGELKVKIAMQPFSFCLISLR